MVSRRSRLAMVVAWMLVVCGLGVSAHAQSQDGHISGTVRDSTGATVPGVSVTATNQAGGATKSAVTAADGTYTINVPTGTYTLSAALRGFGRQSVKDIAVAAGGTASADFSLAARAEDEVTVTAMLREGTVQDTPFSVAAPTEEVMHARGIDSLEAVAANVAGFTVQNLGPGQSTVAMRGVSAGQIVRDQPGVKEQVGSYLDDSVISLSLFTPDVDLFDVNRVEVLRGPQGTLFGSGSLSGTVRYITNQPELGVTKYFGEFGGNATSGSLGGDLKAGANFPLGDFAAARIVGYYTRTPGFIDAVQPGNTVNENVNSGNRTGFRAAVKIAPNDNFSITPRFIFQRVDTNGWNRADAFNILANPFTTTRPAISLGEREQFTQLVEPFTDDFFLGDVNLKYRFGSVEMTSITSYTNRDILAVRDATALTGSITGGSIGLPENVYSIGSPLDDATKATAWTQEVRFTGGKDELRWVAGGFYGSSKRHYNQSLLVAGFESITGIPTAGNFGAGRDILFFSDLDYDYSQLAVFGEATYALTPQLSLTGGLRYYNFNEDRVQIFDGIFAAPGRSAGSVDASGFAPRLIADYKLKEGVNLNAQVSKGFRLGGINDPLNLPLCTPADLATFGGQDNWKDEKAWNYEVGAKSRVLQGKGTLNASLFYMDIHDLQATVTAGSCSSRVIFNVPKSRSSGVEIEFAATPSNNFDFAVSASILDSVLKSTLTSTDPAGVTTIIAGIKDGNRLPAVPKFQLAAAATYQWPVMQNAMAYVTGTFQHQGSRFTQIGDQDPAFGTVNLNSFAPNNIGGPFTQPTFTFNPELPAYSIANVRFGVRRGMWDVALFVNNITDERALLSLDQERGSRARVSYFINQPRTFGFNTRVTF